MDNLIKKIPLPMSGLMLALAATGNLLSPYGAVYRYAFGIMAAILLVLLAAKAALDPASLIEGFNNPVVASIMPTFSMGMMLLSAYVSGFLPGAALGIWMAGLLLHMILIVLFTKKYIFSFNIKKVFPSYFIVYVGIVCGSITAPAFGLAVVGRYIFWFGLASYLLLLPVVLYRVIKVKEIPEPALPLNVILTAPSSLCLAGYLNSFPDKSMVAVALLCFLSLFMLIFVISWMPKLLKLKFYPSYSAFTFPLVITAIAMKGANGHLVRGGFETGHLAKLISVLEIGSIAMVVYVLARYILFISSTAKK
jgi:exfoliative toxin A/B